MDRFAALDTGMIVRAGHHTQSLFQHQDAGAGLPTPLRHGHQAAGHQGRAAQQDMAQGNIMVQL